jgi:hypothetical protein
MLDVDVNLVSFGSLVPDAEYRSESGKAEKVEKYHIVGTDEQDYCPRGLGAPTGARKSPWGSKNINIKTRFPHSDCASHPHALKSWILKNEWWRPRPRLVPRKVSLSPFVSVMCVQSSKWRPITQS